MAYGSSLTPQPRPPAKPLRPSGTGQLTAVLTLSPTPQPPAAAALPQGDPDSLRCPSFGQGPVLLPHLEGPLRCSPSVL